jgi:hypothetical protein
VRDLGRDRAIDAIVSFAVRGMADKSFARVSIVALLRLNCIYALPVWIKSYFMDQLTRILNTFLLLLLLIRFRYVPIHV